MTTWGLAILFAWGCETPRPAVETLPPAPDSVVEPVQMAEPELVDPPPEPEPEPEPLDLSSWALLTLSGDGERIDLGEQPTFEGHRETRLVLPAPALDELVAMLLAHPELHIEIQAHDWPSADQYGMKPTDRRATEVLDYLADQGVARQRLRSVGYGEDRPIVSNETPEGRAKNRRIEIWIVDE